AFAAERHRDQKLRRVTRRESLGLQRKHAPGLRFNRGVHSVAAADELMQSEGEYRKPGVGLFNAVPNQKLGLDRACAAILVDAGQFRQRPCAPLLASYRPRDGSNEATRSNLSRNAEGAL